MGYASVYTIFERVCMHQGVGIFAGTVYESVQQPGYLAVEY